jgi:bacterioferritin-associated ferredoxin
MINHAVAASHPITIARAEDVLAEAQHCVECICLAAEALDEHHGVAIGAVANIASEKIDEAIAMLGACRIQPTTGEAK